MAAVNSLYTAGATAISPTKGLVAGGRNAAGQIFTNLYIYDSATQQFSHTNNLDPSDYIVCGSVQGEAELLVICAGGWVDGQKTRHAYKFDHAIQGLVRKLEWDLPVGMDGYIRVSGDRLFFIYGADAWKFIETPADGVHWKHLPGIVGAGEPIAVQLSYLA